jgi:hypothetical protein
VRHWAEIAASLYFHLYVMSSNKKIPDPVTTGFQGLHPAQLDPFLPGKYLVPENLKEWK